MEIPQHWHTNNFYTEQQFQAAAIMMISKYFPKLRNKVWHTKNETYLEKREGESKFDYDKRCAIEGARNKAQGMLAGVMDILVVHFGILYKIELKQPKNDHNKVKGELSDAQILIHGVWNKDCPLIPCVVCYTLYDVYVYCKRIVESKFRIIDHIVLKFLDLDKLEWSGEFSKEEINKLHEQYR